MYPPPFHTVLIANRGEIALRVIRTCRRLGVHTVAIHTVLDQLAPHVRAADEAVQVPSYLDVEAVVAAARATGAEAVHPGYGFLSERAEFARAVEAAGIRFVGPPPDVIDLMGRKDAAREVAVEAGVPVVPSYELDGLAAPASVGAAGAGPRPSFPVLVKAAAGGGGKGMRVVRAAADLEEAAAAAAREARAAFGDDTLLVEKYVERGRHLEVQILADGHGRVVHLFERDCSTQRRHQKVIEEAPAPTIDADLRGRLTAAAVALARRVGYVNAGTVEFLLDTDTSEFYFLEMNTRLQVEHPVTEAIAGGVDLVEEQLRIAAGAELSLDAGSVIHGHAIEARIYAEDPYAGFLPQAGTAELVRWPDGPGIRVDHALESGQVVSTAYDPMLGKVIVHGPDRESARRALVRALDDTAILGLTTNTGFLRELVASDAFRDATIDTAWLDRNPPTPPDPSPARHVAARELAARARSGGGPFRSDGFRLGADPAPYVARLDEDVVVPPGTPRPRVAAMLLRGATVELAHHGQRYLFTPADRTGPAASAGDGRVTAPMPGTLIDVRVQPGQQVEEGEVLGVLEAMKMELALPAPYAGTVTEVDAAAGRRVALGATLFVVAPTDGTDGPPGSSG